MCFQNYVIIFQMPTQCINLHSYIQRGFVIYLIYISFFVILSFLYDHTEHRFNNLLCLFVRPWFFVSFFLSFFPTFCFSYIMLISFQGFVIKPLFYKDNHVVIKIFCANSVAKNGASTQWIALQFLPPGCDR